MVQKDSPIRVAHEHASPPINGSEVVASFPASEQLPGVQYVSPSARGWFASPGTSTRATVQATRRPNRKVTNKFQRPERRLEPRRILRGIPDLLAYCRVFDKFSYCNPRPFRRREEEDKGGALNIGGDLRRMDRPQELRGVDAQPWASVRFSMKLAYPSLASASAQVSASASAQVSVCASAPLPWVKFSANRSPCSKLCPFTGQGHYPVKRRSLR